MYPAHTTQSRIPEIPVPGYQDHHRPPPSHHSAAPQAMPPARLPIRVNPSQRWSGAVPIAVAAGYKPTIPSTIHRPKVRPAIHPIQPLLLPGYEHSDTTPSRMSRTFSTQEVMHKLSPSSSHIPDGVGKINTHLPSKVPGFWSQAHVYIANLIAQNKDLIQGYKVSNRMLGTAENLTPRFNSRHREIILPGSSQHQSYDIIDDKSNGDELIDVTQIQRTPVPIVRFTDIQTRKRRRTPELERQTATSPSGSIKVPKYDSTLPPEYSSHPKPPYLYPADAVGLRQMMAQNPAFRGLTNINKELTDIRMAMAAEYQATFAMKTLMQSASGLQPAIPNTSLTQHATLVAEERKRRAMRAMIQARSELEEIVAEEAKSALQMSRHTLRERAAVPCSLPAAPSHINVIRPRTILPHPAAAAPHSPRILVNKPPAGMQELMINQRMILQRHFMEERKRRMSAAQTMGSAMLPSKFPRIPSPINGHSGELRVDANGKSFIC